MGIFVMVCVGLIPIFHWNKCKFKTLCNFCSFKDLESFFHIQSMAHHNMYYVLQAFKDSVTN